MTHSASIPALEFIFAAHVTVDPALDLGDVGKGRRRIVPITGGDFSGPQMRGQVLPGGADWQVLRSDGTAELEARYTLRTDDGVLIYDIIVCTGEREPAAVKLRFFKML